MAELETWLRGPIAGVPDMLQPVAHALLQARHEVATIAESLPPTLLWTRPAGVAAPGFHLRHLAGVLDRLFTYARGEMPDERQLAYLATEGVASGEDPGAELTALREAFDARVEVAIAQLRATAPSDLTAPRAVGRAAAPSTVIGLLVHAAEHTTRHVGQLLVTVRVLGVGEG